MSAAFSILSHTLSRQAHQADSAIDHRTTGLTKETIAESPDLIQHLGFQDFITLLYVQHLHTGNALMAIALR